jgi:hypothetical protein
MVEKASTGGVRPAAELTTTRESGALPFLASGNYRWQEKAESFLCFDVELAVAPGLDKNHLLFHTDAAAAVCFLFKPLSPAGALPCIQWHPD